MMRRMIGILVFLILTVGATSMWAQVSTSATIGIMARIPGSITLSLRSTPVSIAVANGTQSQFNLPLSVQWNLDPREVPAFGVTAYFRDPRAALSNPFTGTSVSADELLASWGEASFSPFSVADGTAPIFHTVVQPDNRRGEHSANLQLKVADDAVIGLPDGDYQGVLYLEVRNY